ncbi:hypothetical protein ACFOSV_03235 [Algoriphagus namhaensis]|uniref:Uncharacterized protein n=1 Tax=Algoriphagus namhaensis TaxID=915353 RepID=A0ABV8AN56_9BACT
MKLVIFEFKITRSFQIMEFFFEKLPLNLPNTFLLEKNGSIMLLLGDENAVSDWNVLGKLAASGLGSFQLKNGKIHFREKGLDESSQEF